MNITLYFIWYKLFEKNYKTLIAKSSESGFSKGIVPVYFDKDKKLIHIYTFAGMDANILLCELFRMYYDISIMIPSNFHITLKSNEINENEIESLFYNVEEILKEPSTERYFNDETEAFKKNKFIEYLPEENCGRLKMDILYDKKGLIDLSKNNLIGYIDNNGIYKYLIKSKNKNEDYENKKEIVEH